MSAKEKAEEYAELETIRTEHNPDPKVLCDLSFSGREQGVFREGCRRGYVAGYKAALKFVLERFRGDCWDRFDEDEGWSFSTNMAMKEIEKELSDD